MSYTVIWTSRFKKDYKLLMKQGADMALLDDVIRLLRLAQPCRNNTMTTH